MDQLEVLILLSKANKLLLLINFPNTRLEVLCKSIIDYFEDY